MTSLPKISRRDFLKVTSLATPKLVAQGKQELTQAVKNPLVTYIEEVGEGQLKSELLKTSAETVIKPTITRRRFLIKGKLLGAKMALAKLSDSKTLMQRLMESPSWFMNTLNGQTLALNQAIKAQGLPKNKVLRTVVSLLMKSPLS
ncbi:MAG: hypothetical protein ACKO37_05195 [Vampirovibrionales bacterium]